MPLLRSIAAQLSARFRRTRDLPAPPPAQPFPPGGFLAYVLPIKQTTRFRQSDSIFTIVASMRLRALIPARHLAKKVPVWFISFEDFMRDPSLGTLGTPGAIVLGKLPADYILRNNARLSELFARIATGDGNLPLCADMPDNLAALGRATERPHLASYQRALGASFTFTVPTRALGERLVRDARRGIVVIEDPYENRARPVRVAASSPVRLMWFGELGLANTQHVEDALAATVASLRKLPLQLEVVTRAERGALLDTLGARLHAAHPSCELRITDWSLEATEEALERCDFVLIPQEVRRDWSVGKSHNRLVTAIRGGRFAIASPIPAYRELSAYAWIGEDLAAGVRWALAHPEAAAARVAAGQPYVERRFSPQAVGRRWAELLGIA